MLLRVRGHLHVPLGFWCFDMSSCSTSLSDLVDLPFASYLNGMKLANCEQCDPQDFVKAISSFSLRPLQCCLVTHPWVSFAVVTALFCFMTLYLVHMCSSRRKNSGDIYILQVLFHIISDFLSVFILTFRTYLQI